MVLLSHCGTGDTSSIASSSFSSGFLSTFSATSNKYTPWRFSIESSDLYRVIVVSRTPRLEISNVLPSSEVMS
ncbi:hypothetical protein LSAT2_000528 [Lamellibrachia satsuma]|nr:hypothetical protein LSAT2_000528 [Lamellibrachia satsuma]